MHELDYRNGLNKFQVALELFAKTQAVEMDGGMMIKNGARRRTPGGVYLHLLRGLKDPRVDVKEVT